MVLSLLRYDPKVPDGTSVANLGGYDTKYYKDMSRKGDTPGNLFEWQKNVSLETTQTD